jgi:TP901 family phage tail tape measure protein
VADRSIVVRFRAEVAQFKANTAAASKTLSDFADRSEKTAKKHRTEWDKVGRQSALVGTAIAAGLAFGINAFADFDQAMSAAAAGTNATVNELGALREAAIKAGADTQYSATEAAQAITEMGKAGVSTKDILGGGLTGALNLAAAGQLDVAKAAELSATALVQFNLQGSQLSHVADLYAAAAGKAQGGVEDIGLAMKYAGITANSMGVSIEQTTGTLALFASKGLIGEQAGTTFRSMLLSLTSPSKLAKQTLDDLGISVYDGSGKFIGLQGAADELRAKLGPLDEATRNQALGQIFGNESMNGAIALYQGGGAAVQEWTDKVNDAGFAQRQAAKLTDNWKGDLERLSGSLDTVLIKNGSAANGALRGITQSLEGVVDGFGQLPQPLQTSAVALTAATAATAIFGGGLLYLVPKAKAAKVAIVELGVVSEKTATKGFAAAGKAAKGLGAAFTALTIAGSVGDQSKALSAWGDQRLVRDLLSSGNAVDGLNKRLLESSKLSNIDLGVTSFGDAVKSALDPSALEQFDNAGGAVFSMFGFDNLSNIAVAKQRLTEVDAALVQLKSSGHGKDADRIFGQLANEALRSGATLEQFKGMLPGYSELLAQTANDTQLVGTKTDDATKAIAGAQVAVDATGSAMILLGDNADAAGDAVKALADVIQGDMDAASKAFVSATDVLGKYDPEKAANDAKAATEARTAAEQRAQDTRERIAAKEKRTVADTQALRRAAADVDKARAKEATANAKLSDSGLTAMYRDTLANAKKFTADITEATRRGLDPNTVAKLLQEGPEQAAPALKALLGTNSRTLIKMSNDAEAELRRINAVVVEQSRLTSMAINAPTDQMASDLDVALGIASVKAANGGKATADAIAKKLKVGVGEVKRIAGEFGIALASIPPPPPIPVNVNTAKARADLADLRQQLANMDGMTAHTYVQVSIANERDRRQDAANSKGLGTTLTDPNEDKKPKIHRASGGPIPGYSPSPTADNIPLMATAGEHMWSVAEVAGAGGHAGVSRLRALARSGALSGSRGRSLTGSGAASYSTSSTRVVNHYGDIVAPSTDAYLEEKRMSALTDQAG